MYNIARSLTPIEIVANTNGRLALAQFFLNDWMTQNLAISMPQALQTYYLQVVVEQCHAAITSLIWEMAEANNLKKLVMVSNWTVLMAACAIADSPEMRATHVLYERQGSWLQLMMQQDIGIPKSENLTGKPWYQGVENELLLKSVDVKTLTWEKLASWSSALQIWILQSREGMIEW